MTIAVTIRDDPKGWREVLATSVPPKTRVYRARWVLALHEAAQLARPVTWEEWNRIWFGRQRVTLFAAKRALDRLKAELLQFGVKLRGRAGGEIFAGAEDVRELVEPWVLRAREIEERIAAKNERRSPELVNARREALRVRAADVVEAAGDRSNFDVKSGHARPRSYLWLCQRFGIGSRRLRYLLECKGAARAATRRRRIEDDRSTEVLGRALREFDRGGTVRDVAGVLGCSKQTASLFLKRQGRSACRGAKRPVSSAHWSSD